MPIYEYHCSQCDSNFDRMKKFSELEDPTMCDNCETTEFVSKLISAPRMVYGNTGNGGCGNVLSPDSTLTGSERGTREEHYKKVGG